MKKPIKTEENRYISLKIPSSLYNEISNHAYAEKRSLAQMIRIALTEWIEK